MMDITYQIIKPIIGKEEQEGNQVKVEFQAFNQDEPIKTIGIIADETSKLTSEQRQLAIVNAFLGLKKFYEYDQESKIWIFKSIAI